MRTTIYLEDKLLKAVKKKALEEGQTFTDFTAQALRESLLRHKRQLRRGKIKLPLFGGDGLQPGVDLSNGAALLDVMDS